MIRSPLWTLFAMMRPSTGGIGSRPFRLFRSGLARAEVGNLSRVHLRARASGGFGHSIVGQHDGTSMVGGVGHWPTHGFQPAGAPALGQTDAHSGFLASKWSSSHGTMASGTAASFGGSGISSL